MEDAAMTIPCEQAQRIEAMEEKISNIDHTLHGNGDPGIKGNMLLVIQQQKTDGKRLEKIEGHISKLVWLLVFAILSALLSMIITPHAKAATIIAPSGVRYVLERFGAGQTHEIIGTTDTAITLANLSLGGQLVDPATGYRITRLSDAAAWRPADAARFAKKYEFGCHNGYATYANESSDGKYCVLFEVTSDRGFLVQIKPEVKLIAAMGYCGDSANIRWRRDAGHEHELVIDGQWDSQPWLKQFSADVPPKFNLDMTSATLLATHGRINMDAHADQAARYRACFTSGSTQLYDFAQGRFIGGKSPAWGHDVSPLGRWWLYKEDNKRFVAYDTSTSTRRVQLPMSSETKNIGHIGWCVDAAGRECVYYMDNGTDQMRLFCLESGEWRALFDTSVIGYNYHGAKTTVPGWLFLTTYAGPLDGKWHRTQILMYRITDGLIWRVGAGYQYGGNKHLENFAAPNPDCSAVQFSANGNGTAYLDGFRLELPAGWAAEINALVPLSTPELTPTPIPIPTPQPTATQTPGPRSWTVTIPSVRIEVKEN